jgi:hypothetical protein
MARSNRRRMIFWSAAALSIVSASPLAVAQFQNSPLMQSMSNYWAPNSQQPMLGQLANDEAVVVDLKSFNIAKAGAKGDMSSHIDKLKAREVTEGAVIFRSGDKLYIVDGKEVAGK